LLYKNETLKKLRENFAKIEKYISALCCLVNIYEKNEIVRCKYSSNRTNKNAYRFRKQFNQHRNIWQTRWFN